MSEPKVLHEWTKDGKDFRILSWSGGLRAEVKVTKSARTGLFEPEWFTAPEEEVYDEILRLSAELARARAQGRLEGMREAYKDVKYEHDLEHTNTGHCVGAIRRLIIAAELEYMGGE